MKRFIAFFFIIVSMVTLTPSGLAETKRVLPNLQAQGALVMEQDTGKIIYNKALHKRLYPASTTKILTALIAIEKGDLKDVVTVGKEINLIQGDSSKAGLYIGQRISLKNLIYALLLPSGNDAANTIAVHIGRKASGDKTLTHQEAINYFVELMNKRAKELGTDESNFINPHGYHNSKHYTTIDDLSLIIKQAFAGSFFKEVVKTPTYTLIIDSKKNKKVIWKNSNELIQKDNKHYYANATGVKTGYTSSAGYCLVSSASNQGKKLFVIVLKSTLEGRWSDTKKLYTYGFNLK
jgi:serine-type D-Ala-D-Ala carboxypeptidase (penicillin-binding protein 5/6)